MLDNKKGFIRMVEILIFSFILFVLLLPNFFYYPKQNDWRKINSYLLCNDLLYSLGKSNLLDDILITDPITDGFDLDKQHKLDIEKLKNITERIFPITTGYEYEIKNIAPFEISIGCNCTQTQLDFLKTKILTPSYPTAKFNLKQLSIENFSLTNYDLYIIFGEKNLSLYRQSLISILNRGNGLVLVRNFTSQPDGFTKDLFGISYSSSTTSLTNLSFNNLSNPMTARIAKRFIMNLIRINTPNSEGKLYLRDKEYNVSIGLCVNITNCSSCINEGESCTIPKVANITLYQIDPLADSWVDLKISGISNPRNYIFKDNFLKSVSKNRYTILSSNGYTGANARILNNYSLSHETRPRVFWIYDYNKNKDDLNLLFKTAIIWASGEHYFVFNNTIPRIRNSCKHFYYGLRGNNIPFLIKLYYWNY